MNEKGLSMKKKRVEIMSIACACSRRKCECLDSSATRASAQKDLGVLKS